MDIAALKQKAREAGEMAQLHWYADDRSDDPVDPDARIRLILTDPAQVAAWAEAGEADAAGVLDREWESPRPALSYVRVWARAVAGVLDTAGVSTRQDLTISERLDTASLDRGLALLADLGRISVADILAERPLIVSRIADGPVVLEVSAEQFARGGAWLASTGLPLIAAGDGARLALGTDLASATGIVVEALRELEGSPTATLIARPAPGSATPWP